MLKLISIEKCKAHTTGKPFFRLLCSDTYDNKNWLCGSPTKIVNCSEYVLEKALGGRITQQGANEQVGKCVYVMYNENGYTSFIRFYDEDDQRSGNNSGYSAPPPPEPPAYSDAQASDDDYAF